MEFVVTGDGSKTLYHPETGEHYHSTHGAVQESRHVFLEAGLKDFLQSADTQRAAILEVGFGTGLNFLLTAQHAVAQGLSLQYTGIEAYPLSPETIGQSGYDTYVDQALWTSFIQQYPKALRQSLGLGEGAVQWEIANRKLMDFESDKRYDVLYFDAFAAVHQPEMWSEETLAHVSRFLRPQGFFVTYAITGKLKRSLRALGFAIEKLPGAPGKREMLRAIKI